MLEKGGMFIKIHQLWRPPGVFRNSKPHCLISAIVERVISEMDLRIMDDEQVFVIATALAVTAYISGAFSLASLHNYSRWFGVSSVKTTYCRNHEALKPWIVNFTN